MSESHPAPASPTHTALSADEQIRRLRGRIDQMDAELAELLERRALVAARVQRLKPVGYFAGRDMRRERELVERMAERAPRLGPERLADIMDRVISAGLAVAQEEAARTS
ncbi:chorismate mutase [Nocardiopsis sp. TSRI0078]|uniref:chorismate mutase n=1 Tax=unclassified Nocardiopsis TaxID=2649073 RepID=UPI0009393BB0|nr:chorismate mutase [Nocardiopsis sp. TSRI0078]OKI17808.1 chorismate mutase [Nocardiopsis sp. TSRI0078]